MPLFTGKVPTRAQRAAALGLRARERAASAQADLEKANQLLDAEIEAIGQQIGYLIERQKTALGDLQANRMLHGNLQFSINHDQYDGVEDEEAA